MRESILSASAGEFWFWIALLVAIGLASLYGLFRFFTRARQSGS